MKLFGKRDERKKKAAARKFLKLQKFLEKGLATGMQDINAEMEQVIAEYQDVMKDFKEIMPMMDEEIATKRTAGEDVTEMEKNRQELKDALDELKTALASVPASPFTPAAL